MVQYTIDKDQRLVITIASRVVEYPDGMAHQDALMSDPDFDPTFSQFCDFSRVEKMNVATWQIRELARRDVFAPGARRSVYATRPFVFGLARMFVAFRQIHGGREEMMVFYDRESALHWLRGERELPYAV
jgi:hypothetical protein